MKQKRKTQTNVDRFQSLFDHLKQLTERNDSTYFNTLTDADKRTFSPYMINRFLSMNSDWIDVVDAYQRYTVGGMDKREVFLFYNDVLPKGKVYLKYIKSTREIKVPQRLIDVLVMHFECSERTAKEYYVVLMETPEGRDELLYIMGRFGLQMDEQKKIMKETGLRGKRT